MLPSLVLIYYGECQDMIGFYSDIFGDTTAQIQTYAEMPLVDAYGIKDEKLDLVWRATLTIRYGSSGIRFRLSDSMVIAMGGDVGYKGQAYNPLICIEHNDEQYVRDLFEKLYSGVYSFEEIQKGIHSDKYGIRWIYKKSNHNSIYHCLEFNGYCRELVDHIKDAYQVTIGQLLTYGDSHYADLIGYAGKDKIYSAVARFWHNNCCYDIKFSDSVDSALQNLSGYDTSGKFYQIIIAVEASNEEDLRKSFERLSVGATLNRPFMPNEEGIAYGSLIDSHGIVWEVMTMQDN